MLFTDALFLFYFLPVALLLHGVCVALSRSGSRYGNLPRLCFFLLTVVFYASNKTWWLFPLFVCIFFDFLWATLLERSNHGRLRLLWVWCSVAQNLTLLAVFKYWDAILRISAKLSPNMAAALPTLQEESTGILLPAGISFYVFESLSFVIDVYRRKVQVPKNPLEFFAFIAMFPRFVAGPIVRYRDMVHQFKNYRGMQVESGLYVFALGLFLKVIFADNFAIFSKYAFGQSGEIGFFSAWVGAAAFSFQLYFDFSGYSLMAIGLGKCFGFEFPINFDRPYASKSITEFWRRWHITLGTWIKDYLFVPLATIVARRSTRLQPLVLIAVFVVIGIWHGASRNFVAMGAWFGCLVALEAMTGFTKKLPALVARLYVWVVVCAGWVFFRASYMEEAFKVLQAMFLPTREQWASFTWEPFYTFPVSFFCCVLGLSYSVFWDGKIDPRRFVKLEMIRSWEWGGATLMMVLSVAWLFSSGAIPFIYFQF